ncbi:copper amine oxidase N-terminal domain-containing protein [Paenibacillus sp. PK3_47]|uniref:copper amine oxidase N-terminal domain-containing protein n=1 Tax=Paenibacillus sp. PK3_47 TaxID=2072642 RepID=UPI00201DD58E|nr:copper amine oxidase N-terminal domain-containing protein [Paenibacillus sp. PK3_47]
MKRLWLLVPVLLMVCMLPAMASAAGTAYFKYTYDGGGQVTTNALLKDGTVYVSAGIMESAGLRVTWDKAQKQAMFRGWQKSVKVTVGGRTAAIDGKAVSLGGVPFRYRDELYVPARFLVQALDGQSVSWDAQQRVYTASGIHSYESTSATYGGVTYTVDKKNGKLYTATPAGGMRLMADLGSQLYDMVNFDFKKTGKGLIYLTITDVYGEPHINNKWYTLIIKDGMVIRQASVHYWKRYGDNVKMYGSSLLLTDGRTLRVIEDGTGKVTATLDLVKLGGEEDSYLVEGMDDDFLLIRPNDKGLLMLIDRHTGEKTLLYKELLDPDQQEYAEMNDVPFFGDQLQYLRREGNTLYFENGAVRDGREYPYVLKGMS